jgi:hypothetical protein
MRCALRETYVRYSKANVLYSVVAPFDSKYMLSSPFAPVEHGDLLLCVENGVFLTRRGLARNVHEWVTILPLAIHKES